MKESNNKAIGWVLVVLGFLGLTGVFGSLSQEWALIYGALVFVGTYMALAMGRKRGSG